MNFTEFKEAVIRAAAGEDITGYELYYQVGESIGTDAFRHEIRSFSSSVDGGVCLRLIKNGKMGYASTEALSEEEARSLVRRAVDNAETVEAEEPVFLGMPGETYTEPKVRAQTMPKPEELTACALNSQEKLYAEDPAVTDGCETEVFAEKSTIAICNSNGLDLRHESTIVGFFSEAVVEKDGEKADDYAVRIGDLSDKAVADAVAECVGSAKKKLGGEPAPTGSYPVVFSPAAMKDLLATFSSDFSAENVRKGLSPLKNKEGCRIAPPLVTLVDDPFCEKNPMQIGFDAEGSATRRKNVIENGVLNTLLYDLKNAALAGKKTTANASKLNYRAPVTIRPFTFYLAPGDKSEDDLLREAENGVYIDSLGGLHAGANAVTGDFSLQSAGFLIEDGKLTKPVKSFTVAGNFFTLLENVRAVADNMKVPRPFSTTAYGSPSVLVDGLTVAGK